MSKDVIELKDEQVISFFNGMNETCHKKLNELKRSWLDVAGTVPYALGNKLAAVQNSNFILIKSIFYSDKLSYSEIVYSLMQAMRAWVIGQGSNHQSLAFLLHGEKEDISLYVAVENSSLNKCSIEASFPGILFGDAFPVDIFVENMRRGGIISGIPAYTDNEHEQLYSMDLLIRGMRGRRFTLLIAGNPLYESEIEEHLSDIRTKIGENHENIKANVTKQFGENVSKTLGASLTSFGALMDALTESASNSRMVAKTIGGNASIPIKAVNVGVTVARTVADTVTKGTADTAGKALGTALGLNYSLTKGENKSYSNASEKLNQYAQAYEEALLEHQERLESARSEGAWSVVTYLLAENDEDFKYASSLFKSCLTAHFDVIEPIRIIPLANGTSNWDATVATIPIFTVAGKSESVATLMNSSEFAALMSLPSESHPGLEIKETQRFSVNQEFSSQNTIFLGNICDRKVQLPNKFSLSQHDLAAHTLVTGLTGMGKSTTIREILAQAEVPFLVIEPAKSEYRALVVNGQNIRVFTAGDEQTVPLRINPFELAPGDSLYSHIDSLAAILNAAFPMEGPMAALIEQGLVDAYEAVGWDVTAGAKPNDNRIPTMDSFYEALKETIEKQKFQGDYGANIKSALLTRIKSLCIGPRGRLFNSECEFDVASLLSEPTVIEMKKVGNDETKAFLTGILLHRIYKYLEQRGNVRNLTNLLVLEEAHRIFKRASENKGSLVGNNTAHHAVEIFENILAEVRSYGLGVIIADQMPLRLSDGAIKNTNFKIVHRLGALEDAIEMGGSMGLSKESSAFINVNFQ